MGVPTLPYTQWGCRFVDLDLDGFQDLFLASGNIDHLEDSPASDAGYAQPCQVLRNDRAGGFTDVSSSCGPFFGRRQVARGVAFGDYDNDGDADILIACNNQPALLLRNDSPRGNHWVCLSLVGSGCCRDALGARVRVTTGSMTQTQYVRSGGSYLADHDRRLLFGIGPARTAETEIRWPCGALQRLEVRESETLVVRETGCRVPGGEIHATGKPWNGR